MDHAHFLQEVQASGSFTSREETEAIVASVLMALAHVLPSDQVEALSTRVPPESAVYLRRTGSEPDPLIDSHLFLGWVVSSMDATAGRDKTVGGLDFTAAYSGEEAIRRAQCVFSVLKRDMDAEHQRDLASVLPEQVDSWFLTA